MARKKNDDSIDLSQPIFSEDSPEADAIENPQGRKQTGRDILLETIELNYTFGIDDTNRPFVRPLDSPVTHRISEVVKWVAAQLREDMPRLVINKNAMSEVETILEGKCSFREPEDVVLRYGRETETGNIIIDLGDSTEQFVRVTEKGWSISSSDSTSVLFRRRVTRPFPRPTRIKGGELEVLKRLQKVINVSDKNWELLVGFLVTAMIPDIPHAALYISGEPGTAKSGAMDTLVRILDPSKLTKLALPKDEKTWGQTVRNAWVLPFENVSEIKEWLSDRMCMVVTGSGDVDRALYSDDDVIVTEARRVLIFNGIDVSGIRSDLAARIIQVQLDPIPNDRRLTEEELRLSEENLYADVFGALLNVLSATLKIKKTGFRPKVLPRMADFALWLACVDQVLGFKTMQYFVSENDRHQISVASGDSLAEYLVRYLSTRGNDGLEPPHTAADWVQLLSEQVRMPPYVSRNAIVFGSRLNRIKSGLILSGWEIQRKIVRGKVFWEIGLPADWTTNFSVLNGEKDEISSVSSVSSEEKESKYRSVRPERRSYIRHTTPKSLRKGNLELKKMYLRTRRRGGILNRNATNGAFKFRMG